ncbi:MAG: hypothetical protein M3345_01265 [Actinomycetota bacterium]|nr:hypothetical protein [Actinomycetota bacterium]
MDAIQCPACELKFISDGELRQHIAFDHPELDRELKPVDPSDAEKLRRKRTGST